jgi:cell pole-organizing protein PopZ
MEEILASIRKIISEDSSDQPAAAVPEMTSPEPAAPPETDVLDLTDDMVAAPAVEPEPIMEESDLAPLTLDDPVPPEQDVVFEPIEEEPAPVAAAAPEGGIFSDKTRQSISDAFASIDEPEDGAAPVRSAAPMTDVSGLSVEAVFERAVRESFEPVVKQWLGQNTPALMERVKPLIREWMDENFPALLEAAVRDEVARVRGSKR